MLYFISIWWNTFANEQLCTDSDAPTFIYLREHSYYKTLQATYPLTPQWKKILHTIQETHQPYDIYPERLSDQAICAAYLYEFSQKLRWPIAPSRFGMFHPQDRTVCSAWELPYCYWYRWGEVMSDIGDLYGPELKKDPTSFLSLVTQEDIFRWFASAWERKAYLWDLTFVFRESQYLHMTGVYWNYNSHIGKHLWISEFDIEIGNIWENTSNQLAIRESLWCGYEMWKLLEPVRKHYTVLLNWNPMRYLSEDVVLIYMDEQRKSVSLQQGDRITYTDVLMTHFWEWEKVESLIEFVCNEEFFPVAVVGMNPKLVGKE